ncbi:MAG TPA: nitroreductase family protein [Deltaproteobacteria bacterium]|nr:nitroreductase family protein [Deltaproteobacteria bacterium]HPR54786.1 nitroreductase family protein [Deltaproteobacteria bacterium]
MISYEKRATDIIRIRRSWRSYRPDPVSGQDKERIRSFLSGLDCPPFGSTVRLVLADALAQGMGRVKGTYGVVTGASTFLIGALRPSEGGYEDFGYLFESAVLAMTSLGLGTCWLGGSFNRGLFADMIGLEEGEIIPAISPVGIAAERRSVVDRLFVFSVGSRSRKPFSELFFLDDFGATGVSDFAGAYALPLEMVRLGPSATNRQPWRVVMKDGSLHFYLARTRGYSLLFGEVDLQRVDMGIAMCHFELAAREMGLPGSWKVTDPGISPVPPMTEYVVSWVP